MVKLIRQPRTPDRHLILVLVVATLADRAITVPFMQYEANPLVNAMGPTVWLAFTAFLIASYCAVWYGFDLYRFRIAKITIMALTAFTLAVVVSNVGVILTA